MVSCCGMVDMFSPCVVSYPKGGVMVVPEEVPNMYILRAGYNTVKADIVFMSTF